MTTGYFVEPPELRLLGDISRLQQAVRDLQGASPRIPVLEEDPPEESGTSIWMLIDGRLRARKPDGGILEFSAVGHIHDDRYTPKASPGPAPTAGGGTSTVPPPPSAYVPTSRRYHRGADWSECYWKGGASVYGNDQGRLYYSMYTSVTGEMKSMIHFPNLDELAPGPAGTQIREVWLRLSNLHTNSHAGGVLRIGLHNAGGVPGSFTETEWPPFEIPVGKPSLHKWYQLPNWVGDRFVTKQATGFTLNQRSTSRALYGYAAGDAELRIEHVK